jgi:methyl-accepting chemotaxis protein
MEEKMNNRYNFGDLQSDVKRSNGSFMSVKQEVDSGLRLVQETEIQFNAIVNSASRIAEQIEEITETSEQISAGAEQITAAVYEMAHIAKIASGNIQSASESAQTQLAAMEEVRESASSLSRMADELSKTVASFKV